MTTAGDLINGALRLIGVLAEGEIPSADTSNDCLVAFQQMVDSWNTERLSVYTTQTELFTWPASQASRTIGPTGDFATVRPVSIDDSTYFVVNGLSYNLELINQAQYNGIALKTSTSTWPNVLWVDNSFPDMTLNVYPVPTGATQWHIVTVKPLVDPATLITVISLPPGYLRAFRYNLACELAPEFGVEPSGQVVRIAIASKRTIKRINNPGDIMSMPATLVSNTGRFNIFSGQWG